MTSLKIKKLLDCEGVFNILRRRVSDYEIHYLWYKNLKKLKTSLVLS